MITKGVFTPPFQKVIKMNEPFITTKPVRSGGINSDYIALDRSWGLEKGDLAAFSVHIHGSPNTILSVTKAIGSRGNSMVVYLPRVWHLPIGAMCVVEVMPLDYDMKSSVVDLDESDEDDTDADA